MHVSESIAGVPSFIYWKVREAQGILFSQELWLWKICFRSLASYFFPVVAFNNCSLVVF